MEQLAYPWRLLLANSFQMTIRAEPRQRVAWMTTVYMLFDNSRALGASSGRATNAFARDSQQASSCRVFSSCFLHPTRTYEQ